MRKSKEENRDEAATAIALTMKRMMAGMRLLLEAELEAEGLTLAQLRMLSELNDTPEISAAALARSCYITPQSMQSLVVRAEREGWIVRSPSKGNRRILSATLTPAGRRVFEHGKETWNAVARDMWGKTSLAELRTLNAILAPAVDRLQPKLDALHSKDSSRHSPSEHASS